MQNFNQNKATIKMINNNFCSMELLVKSAQYCAVFDFDVKMPFSIAKHPSSIFDHFYSKCPATLRANLTMPESV